MESKNRLVTANLTRKDPAGSNLTHLDARAHLDEQNAESRNNGIFLVENDFAYFLSTRRTHVIFEKLEKIEFVDWTIFYKIV